jgi:hypothetical protein
MVAANASNKVAVVDTKLDKLAALVDVGKTRTRAVVPTLSTRNMARYGLPATWATTASA